MEKTRWLGGLTSSYMEVNMELSEIYNLIALGKVREMLELVEEMKSKGVELTHFIYQELLISCSDVSFFLFPF